MQIRTLPRTQINAFVATMHYKIRYDEMNAKAVPADLSEGSG